MKKLAIVLLLATCFAALPAGAQVQPQADAGDVKARALIDEMIKALGGDAYLNYQTVEQTGRTYGFSRGEPAGTGAQYWRFWKAPDKERVELTKQRDWIVIHSGDQGHEITFRGVFPEEKELLQDYVRRRHYSLEQVTRVWLKQPGLVFLYEGRASAGNKPTDQVSILNAENEAVTLYLDVDSHLPRMKKFVWRNPETRERNEETELYDNYRLVGGIMTPLAITRARNGRNTNQRFISSVTYNTPLADSMFEAKPTPPAAKK